jgi:hypothetical protein
MEGLQWVTRQPSLLHKCNTKLYRGLCRARWPAKDHPEGLVEACRRPVLHLCNTRLGRYPPQTDNPHKRKYITPDDRSDPALGSL